MISGKRLNNLAAEITAGQFKIISGVGAELGGGDEGPTPHEILEASLAACTILTLQMYANHKKIKLVSANVIVNVESKSKDTSIISRKIQLDGDLSTEEKQRLMEIADKCPIHKLLSSNIKINSELV
jgi:putative redox protein